MLRKLLPIVLALIGTAAGVGAGLFLIPPEQTEQAITAEPASDPDYGLQTASLDRKPRDNASDDTEYVKMNNQFVVPIMGKDRVEALIVAALSIEVTAGTSGIVYEKEPKLRDVFLQQFFDHANIGGFEGAFTAGERMGILRSALLDVARSVLGPDVRDVLITEIARQDAS